MKAISGKSAAIAIVAWLLALVFLAALLSGCTVTLNVDGISTPPPPQSVDNPAFSG
jgi:hypothetical protein